MIFVCVCCQKCGEESRSEMWMCSPASRYFTSEFNRTYSSWWMFLSFKSPQSQMFLSDCLRRPTVVTRTIFPTSWCLSSSIRVNGVWMRTSWRQGLWIFLELIRPHQRDNLKVSERLRMFELRLCRKLECYGKLESMQESLNLCEHFTVWTVFLWECIKELEEFENEWV